MNRLPGTVMPNQAPGEAVGRDAEADPQGVFAAFHGQGGSTSPKPMMARGQRVR